MPYVNGVYMASPGVTVDINDANFVGQTTSNGLGMLLIGPAYDGQPNTPIPISSPAQAIQVLKGGDLLQAALLALNSVTPNGPNQLTVIRPEQATQATSTIKDPAGANPQIALTTTSYGSIANSSKWMIQTGTTQGYKILQGTDFVGPGGQTFQTQIIDNVCLPVLSIAYTGTDTNPTVTVTDTNFTVSATSGGSSVTLASIPLSNTVTVQQLVNQLNQISGIVATVQDPNANDPTGALFDNVSNLPISTSVSSPTTLYANVTAVVRMFNQQNLYFTAVRQPNATGLGTSTAWTYASGGNTPTASNSDWQNAYTTAQTVVGVSLISPVSPSYTLWQMNDAHCQYMASIGQPRRGYVGDTSGQQLSSEMAQAEVLNSNRTSIVWPEQILTDYNGNITTMAPYLVAAQIMGQRAATTPYQALTQQPIHSYGCGQFVTPSMVSQGLAGGVIVLAPNQSGSVVVSQDRTTWLQGQPYDKVENSTGLVADIISADLNQVLAQFCGQPVTPVTVASAASAVLSRLTYWYNQGYLAAQPQQTDVQLTGSGNTIYGTAQAALDVPANYIVLTLTPVAIQTSAINAAS